MKEIDFIDAWLYHIIKYLSSFVPCSHHKQEKIAIFLHTTSCIGVLACFHHHPWLQFIYGVSATLNVFQVIQKHRANDAKRRANMIYGGPGRIFSFSIFLIITFFVVEIPVPMLMFLASWSAFCVIIGYLTLETIPPKTKKDKLSWKEIVKMFGTAWVHNPLQIPQS